MRRLLGALALMFLCAVPAWGQIGARADGIVLNQVGHPIAGAQVRVCSAPASGQLPCATVANIYSDVNLTIPIANPLSTDSNGNYYFYIQGGRYELEFFGAGVVTSQLPDQTITLPLQTSPTFINVTITGNLLVEGTITNSSLIPGCLQIGAGGVFTSTGGPCNGSGSIVNNEVAVGTGSGAISGYSDFLFIPSSANLLLPSLNGIIYVDGVKYTTIQSAVTAAATFTPCEYVEIPPTWSQSDTYTRTNCVGMIDFRDSKQKGALKISQWLATSPISGFPLGSDLALDAEGPADVYLAHDALYGGAQVYTTTSLSVGANVNIAVTGDPNDLSVFASGGYIAVDRNSPNEEYVSPANWSMVNPNHITMTLVNMHAGTTEIDQLGATHLQPGGGFDTDNCAISTHFKNAGAPCRWVTSGNGEYWMYTPNSTVDPWPYGGIGFSVPITGFQSSGQGVPFPTPGDLVFQNATGVYSTRFKTSNGAVTNALNTDAGWEFGTTFFPATAGIVNIGKPSSYFGIAYFNNLYPVNSDLIIKNSGSSFCTRLQNSVGVNNLANCESGVSFGTTPIPDNSGVGLGVSGHAFADEYLNVTDGCLYVVSTLINSSGEPCGVLSASLTTTSASSDNVTVIGMISSGHCSLAATNASAATNIASTYVSAKTTNQITVTHAGVASMTYDIMCVPN